MSARIVVNDAELSRGIAALQARLINTRPALLDLGESLLNSTRERFRSETSPDGAKWAALSKPYARWKARKGRSKTLLQLNGYLFGSLAYQVSNTQLELGSNVGYARAHQFGAKISIPGRTGSVRLRTNAKGELLRQTDAEGKAIGNGKLAVFAGRNHKRSALRVYLQGAYSVTIPARPFLGLSRDDLNTARSTLQSYLSGE